MKVGLKYSRKQGTKISLELTRWVDIYEDSGYMLRSINELFLIPVKDAIQN